MKKSKLRSALSFIFLGKRYNTITSIDEQVRYMTINSIFMVATVPLILLGATMIGVNNQRAIIDFTIAGMCILAVLLIRTNIPIQAVVVSIVTAFGGYCVYLVWGGDINLWAAVWLFAFPPIVIFLCRMTIGFVESLIVLVLITVILFLPFSPVYMELQTWSEYRVLEIKEIFDGVEIITRRRERMLIGNTVKTRVILAYVLVFALTTIYERISILKDRKEKALQGELIHEKNIIQIMKDNMPEGIFLMDRDLKILPQYSLPLVNILAYYEDNLAGKNFLDILSVSLETKQLQILKGYFNMIFTKSKAPKVLEAANPLYEFNYLADKQIKILTAKFNLIEAEGQEPVILGIIQDITREKEFEKEFQERKESQEMEMKNMFDVIQIDPLVFNDFIEDTETNFNYINSLLRDKTLSEREVVTKFFQNVHAIKSNAIILGLEGFGQKLHRYEDNIKKILDQDDITTDDTLKLAVNLEQIMQEKDNYIKIIKRIESFKVSNKLDTVLVHSLNKAVEKVSRETKKDVDLRPGTIDLKVLETKLRKPIKDILFQCVRNSIFHGIETPEERAEKKKKRHGVLDFSIKEIDGKAEITFSDDGAGLNWEKIKQKYLEKNPGAKDVGRNVLLPLIFSPEFSTSEETTTTAGRGVGLSLVKDLVKENSGSIKVSSTDQGLTFKFIFPLPK